MTRDLDTAIVRLVYDHFRSSDGSGCAIDMQELLKALGRVHGYFCAGVSPTSFRDGLALAAKQARLARSEACRLGTVIPVAVLATAPECRQ